MLSLLDNYVMLCMLAHPEHTFTSVHTDKNSMLEVHSALCFSSVPNNMRVKERELWRYREYK